jgi:hypothetical protein
MQINQYAKVSTATGRVSQTEDVLRRSLAAPADEDAARGAINDLLSLTQQLADEAGRLGFGKPAPGRIPLVVSYFWEAQERDKWPIAKPTRATRTHARGPRSEPPENDGWCKPRCKADESRSVHRLVARMNNSLAARASAYEYRLRGGPPWVSLLLALRMMRNAAARSLSPFPHSRYSGYPPEFVELGGTPGRGRAAAKTRAGRHIPTLGTTLPLEGPLWKSSQRTTARWMVEESHQGQESRPPAAIVSSSRQQSRRRLS